MGVNRLLGSSTSSAFSLQAPALLLPIPTSSKASWELWTWERFTHPLGTLPRPAFQKSSSHIHLVWGKLSFKRHRLSGKIKKMRALKPWSAMLAAAALWQHLRNPLCFPGCRLFGATWEDARLCTGQQGTVKAGTADMLASDAKEPQPLHLQMWTSSLEGVVRAEEGQGLLGFLSPGLRLL